HADNTCQPAHYHRRTTREKGPTTANPLLSHPDQVMSPSAESAVGNTPPVIRFDQGGTIKMQGPLANVSTAPARSATSGAPFPLTVWLNDDLKYTSGTSAPPGANRQPVTVSFSKYR